MKVYLVAGAELHGGIASVMEKNGFEVVGHEYTMDAAVVALNKKPLNPDLFIINGQAQAAGTTGGVINRNRSMLVKLKEIRMAAPQSRILLLLPSQNPPQLIHNIISLGIYDIRQTSRFDESTLLDWINNPMSIADFKDFRTGQVPDSTPGEIKYTDEKGEHSPKPFLKKALKGLKPGRSPASNIAGSSAAGGRSAAAGCDQSCFQQAPPAPGRAGAGRLSAVLGVGDVRIEEWVKENFSDQMDVIASLSDPEDIKRRTAELSPDILVIMRHSAAGGVPGAGELAAWAAGSVPAVLFIVGELDEPGKEMADRAAGAGVRHIISCERGGYISGDELVYVLSGIIRDLRNSGRPGPEEEAAPAFSGEVRKTINSLLQGAGILRGTLKRPVEKAKGGKTGSTAAAGRFKSKIRAKEGLPLEEEAPSVAPAACPRDPTSIVPGGILAVVSPWRPNLAGRLAAQAVKLFGDVDGSEVAYVGASKNSTGAVWLDVPDEDLMMSDWRVPGSRCPIVKDNLAIYAVDPSKDLPVQGQNELWAVVKKARKKATYTVVDFAGDIWEAHRAAHHGRAVVLVILPGSDPVELRISTLWLRNFAEGKQNVVTGIDLRGVHQVIPEGLRPKVVIRNSPADALAVALKKYNDGEFIWN